MGRENEPQKVLRCGISPAGATKGEKMHLSREIKTAQMSESEIWQ